MTSVFLLFAITLVLVPFAFYSLSRLDVFFTRMESGNIKYIFVGDSLKRMIADVRNMHLDGHKLVDGAETRKWWEKKFGIYWIGFPPFSTVKKFQIKRKKEREELAGVPATEWIRDLGSQEVDSLRAFFPRPFLLKEVELGDRQTVDVLVVGKFQVVDAYIPVVELKGDFFELLSSTLSAEVNDIVEAHDTMDDFLKADKAEDGILKNLALPNGNFNQILEKRTGLRLLGATIPKWDPSDPKTREAMNKKFIAEKQQEAELIAAETYKLQLGIRTEADAASVERMAKARGARVKATLENLAAQGASGDTLVKAAANILRAEAQPNLTTLVEGGAPVVVPVEGGRK